MASVLELIEKILDEQRKTVQSRSQQAIAGQTLTNMQTAGAGAQIENQQAQAKFRADLELAHRAYPDMDPVEALVKFKADTEADDRDVKRRTQESVLTTAEARRQEDMAQAAKYAAEVGRESEERARKEAEAQRRATLEEMEIANMRQFGRKQRPQPKGEGADKTPKARPITTDMYNTARESIYRSTKNSNPNKQELREEIYELFPDTRPVAAEGGAAGGGGSPPPAPPPPPGAAPSPTAPAETVSDDAACVKAGGQVKTKPDGTKFCWIP